MQKFCFTAPAQLVVSAALEDVAARHMPIERAAKSREDVVEPVDEGSAVRGGSPFGVELGQKKDPTPVCEEEESLVLKLKEVG